MPNFVKTSQSFAEILRFFNFFFKDGGRPPSWICLARIWTIDEDYIHCLCSLYAKFGCDRCNSFDNMKVSIFGTFGYKTPIHGPKIGVLGIFTQ